MESLDDVLARLAKSKFRFSFHLNQQMKDYVNEKGVSKIRTDAYDLIKKRIGPKVIPNDGNQTPMRQGHPVFIAQHACACCCRGCLYKWHHIPSNRELNKDEIDYIVNLLMKWICNEIKKQK